MIALVTGVAGFVGSAIARRLLEEGHEVRGIDSVTDYYDVRIKESNLASISSEGFTYIPEDLNSMDIDTAMRGADFVFHEAGQPGVRKSWGADFDEYTRENISATQKLLESAKRNGNLKKFIYASSSSIYGDAGSYPTSEAATPAPISPYGVTKLAAENLCTLYGKNFGVPTVSLRYFTVYGPGQRPDMAFTRFARAAVLDETITIFGTGDQVRDFTYIEDVVSANVAVAFGDVGPGSVYNVAGGSNISVNEILDLLADLSGKRLKIEYVDSIPGDVFRTGGSTLKIEEDVGWIPTVSIQEGIGRQLDWAQELYGTRLEIND